MRFWNCREPENGIFFSRPLMFNFNTFATYEKLKEG
jgi:hypothetical protein